MRLSIIFAGTKIITNIQDLQYDEDIFFETASVGFDPELDCSILVSYFCLTYISPTVI